MKLPGTRGHVQQLAPANAGVAQVAIEAGDHHAAVALGNEGVIARPPIEGIGNLRQGQ